nr:protein transport protein sec31-like [Aedes albopictus]
MPGDQSLHHAHTLDEHRSDCCQVDDLGSIARTSRGSRCSNQSGRSARINLQLEKLNELQAIQQKFVEQKYKLLESQLELDEESESVRSKRSKVSKQASIAKVANWVKSCAEQKEDAIIPPTSTETGRPSLPPAPSNQPKPVTATASSYATAQVQQPDSGNQQSPLKHPSLPNQRSFGVAPATGALISGPTQDGVPIRQAVFNKVTGTVPLAQSTPAQMSCTEQAYNQPPPAPAVVSKSTTVPSTAPVCALPEPVSTKASPIRCPAAPVELYTGEPLNRAAVCQTSFGVCTGPAAVFGGTEDARDSTSNRFTPSTRELGPYHIGAPMPPMLHATSTLPPAAVPYRIPTYPVFQPMYQHAPPSGPVPTVGTLAAAPPAVASSYAAAAPPSSPPPPPQPESPNREVSFPQPPAAWFSSSTSTNSNLVVFLLDSPVTISNSLSSSSKGARCQMELPPASVLLQCLSAKNLLPQRDYQDPIRQQQQQHVRYGSGVTSCGCDLVSSCYSKVIRFS